MNFEKFDNTFENILYLSLLYMRTSKRWKDGLIPDMLCIFDIESVLKFLKMFGGKIITVPTKEEFRYAIFLVVFFYCKSVLKMSDQDIMGFFNIHTQYIMRIKEDIRVWQKELKKNKLVIPKRFRQSNMLDMDLLNKMLYDCIETKTVEKRYAKTFKITRLRKTSQ